jgi:hypothetical protein
LRSAFVWLLNPHGFGYDTCFALAWVAVLGFCYAVALGAAIRQLGHGRNLQESIHQNGWLIIGSLLIVAFFITPVQVGAWTHARPRFVPLALLCLLGALRLPVKQALRILVILILVSTAAAFELRNTREFVRQGSLVQEYVSAMDAVEEGSAVLPVVNPEAGLKYAPNLHSWAYYTIARGGWSPYMHAEVTHNPIIYRVIPWGPGEEARLGGENSLRRIAACYDYVLQWNSKEGDAALLRPQFAIVRATAHLHIWRNRIGVRKSIPASNPACASEKTP